MRKLRPVFAVLALVLMLVAVPFGQAAADTPPDPGDTPWPPIQPPTDNRTLAERSGVPVAQRLAAAGRFNALYGSAGAFSAPTVSAFAGADVTAVMDPGGVPHYFGPYPNYANSELPVVDPFSGAVTGGIRKFVDSLPGLGPANANNLNQYIPVAVPDKTTFPGADYYEIELREYTRQMHSDLPPTTLRGYVQVSGGVDVAPINYLGPLIVAQKDRPVRIKFTNKLPTGVGGDLFIPVDTTLMGAGMGPNMAMSNTADRVAVPGATVEITTEQPHSFQVGVNVMMMGFTPDAYNGTFQVTAVPDNTHFQVALAADPDGPATNVEPGQIMEMYTENRATVHLHGNNTVWISDGTPHQWITPADETTGYPKGVSARNVPDMWFLNGVPVAEGTPGATNDPGDGSMTFFYTNAQTARLMFYHDHAFGITRLNVYAGEAAGYLIQDPTERALVNARIIPAEQIPLVIQDKTFVPPLDQLAAQDPTWDLAKWGGEGDLWYPHVYMPNQNPWDPGGMNAFGRWHYAPWFWPPATINFPPIPNPYYDPVNAPWEPPLMPATPDPSAPAEAFMDTPLVNGTAYPYAAVDPKAYRLRILNAANDRFFNLQLYVADNTTVSADGRTNTEVKLVPAAFNPNYPAGWPVDGREGGVPDPAAAGPAFLQIGTEGGFLPAVAELTNLPIDWNTDVTNFDAGLVNQGTLILGPAERADVIVDFSAYAGKTIILYNDAPAPFPAPDPRYDYYTGNPDYTDVGGTPSTLVGYGPNVRTVMQFRVADIAPARPYNAAALKAVLPVAFRLSQDQIIVPQAAYNAAYRGNFPDNISRIFNNSLTFTPVGQADPVTIPFQPKSIQDEMGETYDIDYGRMMAGLGLQLPAGGGAQNFILYPYNSPPVDIVRNSISATPIGGLNDGTQIWKITHNGVDVHTIHFHLFNVQLINRVAWDNAIRMPDPNEVGWKETVRVNPLQDTIVALRPIVDLTDIPFTVPSSIRPIAPEHPLGEELTAGPVGFQDPVANPVQVFNHLVNFGWEYVYHCHLLAHEEMDMMHGVIFVPEDLPPPDAPANMAASWDGVQMNLSWTDESADESHWVIQRAADLAGPWTDIDIVPTATGTGVGDPITYVDTTVEQGTTYYYRVLASNIIGDATVYAAPSIGFPYIRFDSAPSDPSGSVIWP